MTQPGILEILDQWDRRIAVGREELAQGRCSMDEAQERYGVQCYCLCAEQIRAALTPKQVVILAIRVVGRAAWTRLATGLAPWRRPK